MSKILRRFECLLCGHSQPCTFMKIYLKDKVLILPKPKKYFIFEVVPIHLRESRNCEANTVDDILQWDVPNDMQLLKVMMVCFIYKGLSHDKILKKEF